MDSTVLNISYWLVAALPSRVHWDTTCFKVVENAIESYDTKPKELTLPAPRLHMEGKFVNLNPDYTWAVWKAILVTKETIWAETSGALGGIGCEKQQIKQRKPKLAMKRLVEWRSRCSNIPNGIQSKPGKPAERPA